MKKTLFAIIALIGALALSSCGQTNPVEQKVSAISFRQGTEMVLATGESERLTVVFEPEGTTSIRKTLKPVKISPRARYFDLLGRYKFTK